MMTGLSSRLGLSRFSTRGIEGIAIDMGEMQTVALGMAQQARAAAAVAARSRPTLKGKAVAAKTVAGIVDRHRLRCEHKENKRDFMSAAPSGQGCALEPCHD
jgi:hypothetical protein